MRVTIVSGNKSTVLADSLNPYVHILGFNYSAETGMVTLEYADADGAPKQKVFNLGEWSVMMAQA
jgi:hypothetical protein